MRLLAAASLLPLLAAAACTPRAVTPPGRTLALDSPVAPLPGGSDVQVGVSRIGTIWGPELVGGDTRIRHAVSPGLVVEADAGLLHVINDGSGGNRNALTGRLGVMLRSPRTPGARDPGVAVALMFGAGGGHSPTAGSWGTVDLTAAISGTHRWIRPVFAIGGGLSRPFGDTTFTVAEPGDDPVTLQLPRNYTWQLTAGLELGSPRRALVLGGTATMFLLQENSVVGGARDEDDGFIAVGAAGRFALD